MSMDKQNREGIIKIPIQKGKFLKVPEEKSLENRFILPGTLLACTGGHVSQASRRLLQFDISMVTKLGTS